MKKDIGNYIIFSNGDIYSKKIGKNLKPNKIKGGYYQVKQKLVIL